MEKWETSEPAPTDDTESGGQGGGEGTTEGGEN
jgi:hypothetical protein